MNIVNRVSAYEQTCFSTVAGPGFTPHSWCFCVCTYVILRWPCMARYAERRITAVFELHTVRSMYGVCLYVCMCVINTISMA